MSGVAKAHFGLGYRHGDFHVVIFQQLAQLAHGLARDNDAGHVRSAFGQIGVDTGQPVAIGGDATQLFAAFRIGHMHVDTVQVIACFLGRNREFRFVEKPPQIRRLGREVAGVFRRRHDREIFFRQRRQIEVRPARLDRQPTRSAIIDECHQRAIRQLADDLVQSDGGNGGGPGAFDLGGGLVDHFDIQIGGAEIHVATLGFDQDIGKDRNGVAPFDNGLRLTDGLEQRATFDAEFHTLAPLQVPMQRRKGKVATYALGSSLFLRFPL